MYDVEDVKKEKKKKKKRKDNYEIISLKHDRLRKEPKWAARGLPLYIHDSYY